MLHIEKMKYGIYFAYWTNEWDADYTYYIDKVMSLGFDILEISCAAFKKRYSSDYEIQKLSDYAKERNIQLTAGYGPSASENISSSNPEVVAHAMEFYSDLFKKLAMLNINTLGGGIYSYWPVDYTSPIDKSNDWKRAVNNVREIAKYAQEYEINLCLEALNRFEGYLINTSQEAVNFVNEVDMPNVKVMLDTFHMNIEESNITSAIHLAGDKLGHFHVGERNRLVPGQGNLPWYDIGLALKEINYTGNVVMEPFVLPSGQVGSDIKVWRNMVDDIRETKLDEDAENSLRFLKHVFNA